MNTSDQTSIPPDVNVYLNLLIEDSRIPIKNDKVKAIMIEELYESLNMYLGSVFMQHLSPEKIEELRHLQESKMDKKAVDEFIISNISNVENVVSQAFLDFRGFFLSQTAVQTN